MMPNHESPFLKQFNEELEQIRVLLDRRRGIDSTARPKLTLIVGGASDQVNSDRGGDVA